MGNRVEGGVVAYQFAFVAFMAAYSILAQPVHTTILPEMSLDANRGDTTEFADRVRWALDRMAILVLPVSAAFLALVVARHEGDRTRFEQPRAARRRARFARSRPVLLQRVPLAGTRRSTRSATAARPRSSHSAPRSLGSR